EPAAAVQLRVAPDLRAVGDRVEAPLHGPGARVESEHDPDRVALVEGLRVPGDRADQDLAVGELRRHVDALELVPDQAAGPERLAGLRIERERARLGRSVEPAPAVR